MATRGTGIIIEEDFITAGPQFNGDMYPKGYGNEFMKQLSSVNDVSDFDVLQFDFNEKYYQYPKDSLNFEEFTYDELTSEENSKVISIEKICNYISSDWIFIKNIMDKGVKVEVFIPNMGRRYKRNILIRPGEVVRVHFGEFEDARDDRIKASK